jgi:hypothetical protein
MIFTLQLKQGKNPQFTILKPLIIDGIKIRQIKGEIQFRYKPKGNNGYDNAFNLRNALILTFAVSLTPIWGGPTPSNKSDPMYYSVRNLKRMMKRTGSFSTVLLEAHHAERLIEYTTALNSLNSEITGKIYEGLVWYNKGLEELDPTNKFVLFYITLEFLGNYFNPSQAPTAKVKGLLNNYSNDKSLTGEILKSRHKIFHQGVRKYDIEKYIQAMDSAIREAFKDIAFNKIPPTKIQ